MKKTYSSTIKSVLTFKDLVEGKAYLAQVVESGVVQLNSLVILKNGKIHLHKETLWEEVLGSDLDPSSYSEDSMNWSYPLDQAFFRWKGDLIVS